MTKEPERLPRPAAELERLAEYYGIYDTSADMGAGEWAEPPRQCSTGAAPAGSAAAPPGSPAGRGPGGAGSVVVRD
jgi:hypothetical protein